MARKFTRKADAVEYLLDGARLCTKIIGGNGTAWLEWDGNDLPITLRVLDLIRRRDLVKPAGRDGAVRYYTYAP